MKSPWAFAALMSAVLCYAVLFGVIKAIKKKNEMDDARIQLALKKLPTHLDKTVSISVEHWDAGVMPNIKRDGIELEDNVSDNDCVMTTVRIGDRVTTHIDCSGGRDQ